MVQFSLNWAPRMMDTLPVSGSSLDPILTYMNALVTGDPIGNVSELCRRVPISRTTFYRHFESLEDLDARFLRLYFQHTYHGPTGAAGTFATMTGALRAALDSMRQCPGFFQSILVDKTPPQYADRWFQVVDDHFTRRLAHANLRVTSPLWLFQFRLVLGVTHELMVASVETADADLDQLVKATMDFLWSGTQGFVDHARGLPSAAERHLSSWMEQMKGKL